MKNHKKRIEIIKNAEEAMKHFVIKVIHSNSKHTSISWIDHKGELHGKGYITKGKTNICLIKCPACYQENYVLNVISGFCTWCPFDANKTLLKELNNV